MKSEHRHELAENDLSKLIKRGLDAIEPYQNQILIGMLAVTVVVVGGVVLTRSSSQERTAGLARLVMCETAEDYLNLADEFEGAVAGQWARLMAAEEYLREGVRLSLSDRSQSIDRLEEAQSLYETLLQDQSVPSAVREKALYGLAMTLESLSDGDTTAAIAAYRKLLEEFRDSRYRRLANERIEVLQTGRAQEFYAWFHAQSPSPDDRPLPRDFPPDLFGGGDGLADPFAGADAAGSAADDAEMFADDAEGFPAPPPSARRSAVEAPDEPSEQPPADAPLEVPAE